MVQLSLNSPKGNLGARFFPYSGYLGLTPIKVEGAVSTKLDDDGKPLPAKSITVSIRCYEARFGRVGILHSNILADHIQVLWSKPDDQEWAGVGDLDFPFRITLPTKVAGHSTATFQEYRIFWRVEAVVNHIPLTGLGTRITKHFDLPFIRHDLPIFSSPTPPPSQFEYQSSKFGTPIIRYRVTSPTSPIGPLDLVSIPLHIYAADLSVSIRSASLIVERRIQLNLPTASQSSHSAPATPPSTASSSSIPFSTLASYADSTSTVETDSTFTAYPVSRPPSPPLSASSASVLTDSSRRPLLESWLTSNTNSSPPFTASSDATTKTITASVAGVESSGRFVQNDDGVWSKTLTLQWPAAKSSSRWAMGETLSTELASVKFFARVKIIMSSSSGTESLDLAEQELLIVSTNEAERQLAASKYHDVLSASFASTTRSKSKSPRRTRPGQLLPSPPQSPPIPPRTQGPTAQRTKHDSFIPPKKESSGSPSGGKKKFKRPHTSAGPRDKSNSFEFTNPGNAVHVDRDEGLSSRRRLDDSSRSNNENPPPTPFVPPVSTSKVPLGPIIVPQPNEAHTDSSNGSISSKDSDNGKRFELETVAVDQIQMRAWEAELTRIETQSRRSSARLLGFFKRKRTPVEG